MRCAESQVEKPLSLAQYMKLTDLFDELRQKVLKNALILHFLNKFIL